MLIVDIAVVISFFTTWNSPLPNCEHFETESLITPSILQNKIICIEERVYVMAIKNLLQAEFLQVVPVLLLQPKDTICCWARDTVEYESRQSYHCRSSDVIVSLWNLAGVVACNQPMKENHNTHQYLLDQTI
jgi:hypothetical protein